MPIADIFAPAVPKSVGTGRNGRNSQQKQGLSTVPTIGNPVGTSRNSGGGAETCSDRSDLSITRSEHVKPSVCATVPTVPTVPTANEPTCQRCGTAPRPKELGAVVLAGWICERC